MLPFRGVQTAMLTRREDYGDVFRSTTASGTFDIDARAPARMGKYTVHSIFGSLPSKHLSVPVETWTPVDISSEEGKTDCVELPFKIGGLSLPMLTHNGSCDSALKFLSKLLNEKFPKGFTPIISC